MARISPLSIESLETPGTPTLPPGLVTLTLHQNDLIPQRRLIPSRPQKLIIELARLRPLPAYLHSPEHVIRLIPRGAIEDDNLSRPFEAAGGTLLDGEFVPFLGNHEGNRRHADGLTKEPAYGLL